LPPAVLRDPVLRQSLERQDRDPVWHPGGDAGRC
jgi:hypothetical protein